MSGSPWPDWRASLVGASVSDWIMVAAYLLAAGLAWSAASRSSGRRRQRERGFWLLTALLLAFLGVNELFDLQTVLTAIAKRQAIKQGWYEDRRLYQFEFVLALAVAAVVLAFGALRFTRGADHTIRWALLGLIFIAAFVLLRAATFHHVDALLGMGPAAFNWGSIQEIVGVAIVALAAASYRRRGRTR